MLPFLSCTACQIHSQQSPQGQFNFTSHFKWQSVETWTDMWISCPKYFMLSQIRNIQQQLQMSVVRETEIWTQLLLTGICFLCCGWWEMCYQVAMPVTSMSRSVNPLLIWWKPDGIYLDFPRKDEMLKDTREYYFSLKCLWKVLCSKGVDSHR